VCLGNGERVAVPLADNVYLAEVARLDFPIRLVAYDDDGRVIGIEAFGHDPLASPGPRPIEGKQRVVRRVRAADGSVGTLRLGPSTEGTTCWQISFRDGHVRRAVRKRGPERRSKGDAAAYGTRRDSSDDDRTIRRVKPAPTLRARFGLLLALVAASAALVVPTGTAATPCSRAILADWHDNSRIDRVYDLPCYEAAIDSIPTDLLDYTDAADVISRAFQDASGRRLERQLEGPSTTEQPSGVVPAVDASASTSVPIPLLVLGGMSTILLAAGGLGYVSRRRREQTLDD